MNTNVIDKTYELVNALKEDERYKKILSLEKKIEEEYKEELDDFNDIKEKYYEALKYGDYHPSLKEYENKLSIAKAELYKKEYVIEYNKLYREFQNEINDIINIVSDSISKKYRGEKHGCKNKSNR